MIYPRIGTDKSKPVFNNDRADPSPQDFMAFLQHEFNDARIFFGLLGQFNRARRRCDGDKIYCASLGFADYLLREHEDIVVL